MYRSLLLFLSLSLLLPGLLGLAVPPTAAADSLDGGRGETPTPALRQTPRSAHAVERDDDLPDLLNITRVLNTVNGFPNPEVHCSGRSLADAGAGDYASALNIAVTAASEDGVYGACNVRGDSVNGDGALAFRSDGVQVYFCNHVFAATSCDINEYWRADALITASCGAGGGGWVTVSGWSLTIGRDPTNGDGSFRSECGDSLHGVNENLVITNATGSG